DILYVEACGTRRAKCRVAARAGKIRFGPEVEQHVIKRVLSLWPPLCRNGHLAAGGLNPASRTRENAIEFRGDSYDFIPVQWRLFTRVFWQNEPILSNLLIFDALRRATGRRLC